MKKLIIFPVILIILLSAVLCVPASAAYDPVKTAKLELHSDTYLLISMDNGRVIFSNNADKQCAPASLTKIATAAVVLENCDDLETVVTVPAYCIEALYGTGSSTAGLKASEEMTVNNLLHCLLIESANDAAMVLADYIGGGDIDSFVAMMNALAERLGCTNTSFVNPHGLDDEYQFTTCNDIAAIATYALDFPVFEEITSLRTYTVPADNMRDARRITNTNHLMNEGIDDYYCEYAKGVKTGSTSDAGKCVVSTASKDGYRYMCVVMNAPFIDIDKDYVLENCAFIDAKAMFNWVIKNVRLTKVADKSSIVSEVEVRLGRSVDYLTLSPQEDCYEYIPKGNDSGSVMIKVLEDTLDPKLSAPIKKGDEICKAQVYYSDSPISEITLVAAVDVDRSVIQLFKKAAGKVFGSAIAKILGILLLAVFAVLVALHIKSVRENKRAGRLRVISSYNSYKDRNSDYSDRE